MPRGWIGRSRISPRWLFVLPTFLLGAAMERGSSTAQPPGPVGAPAEVYYSPGEDLERIDVALIGEATKQIDMAAYVLTGQRRDRGVAQGDRARREGADMARREHGGEGWRL